MVIRKVLAGFAAAGLVFGSTAAAAAPAARTASPVDEAEGIGTFGIVLAVLILAGIIGVIASDNGEDLPTSP